MLSFLRSMLVAVLLALSCTAAFADFGEALQIIGAVVTALGFPQVGYALIAAGPAVYGLAARRRKKRRAPASSESAEVRS